eukprot:IDg6804t1
MAPPLDLRKTSGAIVHAKACHIRNMAECSRRYGSEKKTKVVRGTVVEALCNSSGQRASWSVTADYEFGGVKQSGSALTSAQCTPESLLLPTDHFLLRLRSWKSLLQLRVAKRMVAADCPSVRLTATTSQTFRPLSATGMANYFSIRRGVWARDRPWGNLPIGLLFDDFPIPQLDAMLRITNKKLFEQKRRLTTAGELLKFFGMLILITRFEFGNRSTLWSTTRPGKYVPAPSLGSAGMSRDRFDMLWRCIRFSDQPDARPSSMSSEQYRWRLVDDFVERFNAHRVSNFSPSDRICVDESMSKCACGRSKIMMRLKLVKTAEGEDAMTTLDSDGVPHGALVLRQLVQPWKRSQRVVCADSYFASVFATEYLRSISLRFIGVVKTATRRYPMKALAAIELQNRGDRKGLVCLDEETFPSCWLLCGWTATGAQPECMEFDIPQPRAAEVYYAVCGAIDQHNRCRQDDLQLERKLGTMDWSMRVNCSIFGMCVVDSWLAYSGCKGDGLRNLRTRQRTLDESDAVAVTNRMPQSGVGAHLTPTKRRRKDRAGEVLAGRPQGRCKVCKTGKTTLECSICREENPDDAERWLCTTRFGSACFPKHLAEEHNL